MRALIRGTEENDLIDTMLNTWQAEQVASEAQERHARVARRYLSWLSRQERFVVCHVNGFSGKEMSFEEIAPKLKKAPEEIEAIYKGAISKLFKEAKEFAYFVEQLQVPPASFAARSNMLH